MGVAFCNTGGDAGGGWRAGNLLLITQAIRLESSAVTVGYTVSEDLHECPCKNGQNGKSNS